MRRARYSSGQPTWLIPGRIAGRIVTRYLWDLMKTLRLRCPCGRNLADVRHSDHDPAWTGDGLVVTPRPNVQQDDYRPWPHSDKNADWNLRTYTWQCRCGRRWERRHERIRDTWDIEAGGLPEYRRYNAAPHDGRVVVLVLGIDM